MGEGAVMATFGKRTSQNGRVSWQAKVRRTGWPVHSRTFATKAQAERWARDVERDMEQGSFRDPREAQRTTLLEALDRYGREVTPRKKGAPQEMVRIAAWKQHKLSQSAL